MIVPLTAGEAFQIFQWARERQAAKHRRARNKRISNTKSDFEIHYEGIRAEYAVHRLFLLPYDPDPRPGGDKNEPDLVLPDGTSMQIKYRGKRGWELALLSTNPADFKADIAVLVYPVEDPQADDVEVIGWITKDAFIEQAEIVNYTKRTDGDRLAVGPEQLRPIEELLATYYGRQAA